MFNNYLPEGRPPPAKFNHWSTSPLWLTNGTEDDALQYSFNIVLQKLLPEFVLYMGNHEMFGKFGASFTRKTYDDIKSKPSFTCDRSKCIYN